MAIPGLGGFGGFGGFASQSVGNSSAAVGESRSLAFAQLGNIQGAMQTQMEVENEMAKMKMAVDMNSAVAKTIKNIGEGVKNLA